MGDETNGRYSYLLFLLFVTVAAIMMYWNNMTNFYGYQLVLLTDVGEVHDCFATSCAEARQLMVKTKGRKGKKKCGSRSHRTFFPSTHLSLSLSLVFVTSVHDPKLRPAQSGVCLSTPQARTVADVVGHGPGTVSQVQRLDHSSCHCRHSIAPVTHFTSLSSSEISQTSLSRFCSSTPYF